MNVPCKLSNGYALYTGVMESCPNSPAQFVNVPCEIKFRNVLESWYMIDVRLYCDSMKLRLPYILHHMCLATAEKKT